MDPPGAKLRQILHIGRISRAHGLMGEIKVQPMTSDLSRFSNLSECLLISPDEKQIRVVQISGARSCQTQVLLRLKDVDSRDAADRLRGWFLSVRREQAIVLPPDQWFICDLIGCAVYDQDLGYLGELSDVLQSVAQDVYVVHKPDEADLLFPALKAVLLSVDITGRRVDVQLPDGLFEVYRGRKS